MKKSTLATYLFYLFPIAIITPPIIRLFGIRISWIEIICWIALIFLFRNGWKAKELIFWTLMLVLVTVISNICGMITVDYSFNLRNFSLIKYSVTYIGAIAIGLHLPTKNIFENKVAFLCLLILFVMVMSVELSPRTGMILASIYGQETLFNADLRMLFMDPNPNMVCQIGTILFMLSLMAYRNSQVIISLIIVMGTTIIIVTVSRGNMVIATVFLLFYKSWHVSLKKIFLLLLVLFIVSLSFNNYIADIADIADIANPQRLSRVSSISGAVDGRINVFQNASQDFVEFPLIGKGYRCRYTSSTNASEVHSQWLGFAFNHGIIGFLILLGFYFSIGRRLRKLYKKSNLNKNNLEVFRVRKLLLAIYVCYFFSMIWWETLYLPMYSSLFFIFFGKIYQIEHELTNRGIIAYG